MSDSAAPVLTQRMTIHLNGGSKFSQLNYEILADGEPTGIMRITVTNGRPQYKKTKDVFINGNEEFDVLETRGKDMMPWLLQQIAKSSEEASNA